jgi:AcrR family transcriptional regulator
MTGELEVHVVKVRLAEREPLDAGARLHGRPGNSVQLPDSFQAAPLDGYAHGAARLVGHDSEGAEGCGQPDDVGVRGGDQVELRLPGPCLEFGWRSGGDDPSSFPPVIAAPGPSSPSCQLAAGALLALIYARPIALPYSYEVRIAYPYAVCVATEHDHRPIWALPQPAGRKPRYTREQIVGAALRIADQEGFDAVTMKRIAAELGAATMTLYYYVRNKSDIVALMQDAILADILVPDGCLRGGWRDAITAIARRTRDVLMAHPWSLASLNEAQFGPNAMRHFEQSLAAVAGTRLALPARFELIAAVDDYVSGNALHAVESLTRAKIAEEDPAMVAAAVAYGIARLQTGDFPQLSAIAAGSAQTAEPPGPPMTEAALTGQFERGLQALLDGLAARMNIS